MIMLGYGRAEDFSGQVYQIYDKGLKSLRQKLIVTPKFRKGDKWQDPKVLLLIEFDSPLTYETDGEEDFEYPEWVIEKIETPEKGIKKIIFRKCKIQDKDYDISPKEEDKAFKELMFELDINKHRFMELSGAMLVRVFLYQDLKRLLEADQIEFISNGYYIYLKCGNIAYRV